MFGNKALHFDGNSLIKFQRTCGIQDTFTYEFWVKAEEEQIMDQEQSTGADGIGGRPYLVGPDFYPAGAAGCGISVGTNGISVYEHSVNHLPARLVCPYDFSDWQHVAVVSHNRKLQLYINGHWMKEEGASCTAAHILPSLGLGGHVYGNFKGLVREFRLWSTARTEDEIQACLYSSLTGVEEGLYFYRDPDSGVSVRHGIKSDIAVSVIMPSHNRCPLNYFSLLAMDRQDYPRQHMEVVFLNDASTDPSATIYDILEPGYSLIYVQLASNRGRAEVRNLGTRIATGRTFIFVDAEMICRPDFVRLHASHHLDSERKIVSGAMRSKRMYTIANPEFSSEQIASMKQCYIGHPVADPLIDRFIQGDHSHIQLLPFELMFDPVHLERWSLRGEYFENILSAYGSRFKYFHYSWMNMITSNVSITKRFFEESGGFDGRFEGFGWEDWELGYRAARKGAIFIHDDAVVNFHQEHPILPENSLESRRNFLRFCEKYSGDMEIHLLALSMMPDFVTLPEINGYLTELNHIRAIYSKRFRAFNHFVDTAVKMLIQRLWDMEEMTLPIAGSVLSAEEDFDVQADLSVIREMGVFPKLLELYERLSKYFYSFT
ncbi:MULTISPECIES: glycosyltransferase [unclassified Paenibacillus]|uniref:glycosyltransferase n=1 Tax=unclassified Paenibacillus TaxID=185978 RepID=UPI002404FF09|nr:MULTISPECIES: glycosyltransferase [unclassified Paenibacillus]MDF9844972.1 glycosyltransferase involved in cell wall biosynthesis [Paenibacillus sp. PastF-2]MDF9851571.1 glycosyltransferase involved in cell wall biosynthesis [Paenibacillus sp. PastM-2]MDF9858155.1 glycosyltransferase involved in cell wall biosynthesis [Paenibacillus sp. PastF-1]MDH6483381.1 glycosyltransferase involved in cell wall biosynthesis [Paenibacillus sp. PastH-2]MDH6510831.1 glycosyltransferase involved in cell wal